MLNEYDTEYIHAVIYYSDLLFVICGWKRKVGENINE